MDALVRRIKCDGFKEIGRKRAVKSGYLRSLSDSLKQYRFVLIYGAGGVAENLLILLAPYINPRYTFIVVSEKKIMVHLCQAIQLDRLMNLWA